MLFGVTVTSAQARMYLSMALHSMTLAYKYVCNDLGLMYAQWVLPFVAWNTDQMGQATD